MNARPKSRTMEPGERLKNLSLMANTLSIDRNQPIRRYYHSGSQMLRMASVYQDEEAFEKAYVLYLKYLTLFVEKIRQHPEYKAVKPSERNHTFSQVKSVMERSEKLKVILKFKYEEEYNLWLQEEELRRQREEEERKRREEQESLRIQDELSRYHDEKEKSIAMQRDYETALFHQLQVDKELEQEQLEEAMRNSRLEDQQQVHPGQPPAVGGQQPTAPQFDRTAKPSVAEASAPPSYSESLAGPSLSSQLPGVPDRSTKPIGLYADQSHTGLRRVLVPAMVMAKFLSIAQTNTSSNVETCAILAGKLAKNKFSITHVIVPKQKGTSDSCTTTGEEEIFEVQEKHELITLGWIHTHPSQTAFLSSVDLHTHLSYQLMLPEAIAIVCAPKYNETGFFVLTPDYGLDFIGGCRETGFHPHPKEPPLFEEGAHVEIDQESDVTLIDLR